MEKNPEGRCAQNDFCTPCEILAHLAKVWHTLPYKIDDFALQNALFSSILLLITFPIPFQVWQGF